MTLNTFEEWHKAGWNDGVAHEKKRAGVLIRALETLKFYSPNDLAEAKEALEQYRREGE